MTKILGAVCAVLVVVIVWGWHAVRDDRADELMRACLKHAVQSTPYEELRTKCADRARRGTKEGLWAWRPR